MNERQAREFLLTALAVVVVVIVAAHVAAYFLGERMVIWGAGMVAIGAAVTGLTVEAYQRSRRESDERAGDDQ
ncbi:hypothetical protein [Streptomyces hydrogenans]